MTKFCHYALGPLKNPPAHAHPYTDGDVSMRAQEESARQSGPNLFNIFPSHHVSFFIAQEAKHSGSGYDSDPVLGGDPSKYVAGEQGPLRNHGSVGPFDALRVERQIVLD
jgi:hypothetical protein